MEEFDKKRGVMMKKCLLLAGFIYLLTGCSAVYVVKNEYIPPQKPNYTCLQKCQKDKIKCSQRCADIYKNCLKNAYERALKIEKIEIKNFNKRYEIYQRKMDKYDLAIFDWQREYDTSYRDWEYFRKECNKNQSNKYACDREDDLRYVIKRLLKIKPKLPKVPKKISFDSILKKEQKNCNRDCGCSSLYDSCYLSCGGMIKPHKICIENCE